MGYYRLKSDIITAIQFTGDNIDEIWSEFGTEGINYHTGIDSITLTLITDHNEEMICQVNDWVLRHGMPNRFYSLNPRTFASVYESVDLNVENPLVNDDFELIEDAQVFKNGSVISYKGKNYYELVNETKLPS